MSLQRSLSRFQKKVKGRLQKVRNEDDLDERQSTTERERSDDPSSSLRSDPVFVTMDDSREDTGVGVGMQTGRRPSREGRDADGKSADQVDSSPQPGPDVEKETPTPSTSRGDESQST